MDQTCLQGRLVPLICNIPGKMNIQLSVKYKLFVTGIGVKINK